MKALTLYQPWASLVALCEKKIETRSWYTSYRGTLAIHAAKKPFDTDPYLDRELYLFADALGLPDIFSFDALPYGAVIATCNLVDCLYIGKTHLHCYARVVPLPSGNELAFGDYTEGRFAWVLNDVRPLPEPIPAKGRQGLWNWEPPEGIVV